MKKYIIIIFILISTPIFASNAQGYAWSESLGWFDFSNVNVTDTGLAGYAYNDNTGWLSVDGVANNNGTLSGYAWSESVGYFDFSNVSILNGNIVGYAYNDNTGWLSFSSGTNVTTSWSIPVTASTSSPIRYAGGAYYGSGSSNGLGSIPFSLMPKPVSGLNIQTINLLSNIPRNLTLNSNGDDVKLLQKFLNSQGFIVSTSGPGSVGNETAYFGTLTRQALSRFQSANNVTPAIGYFGPVTKKIIKTFLNK